ncbi:MAG: anti-sigma factor family protein [Kribbellaceae bacterium]
MSCATEEYLGAYVLGALDAREDAWVRTHLATCATCRDSLRELEWLPARLGAVPAQDVEALAVEPPLLDRVLAASRRERRVRRRRLVLAAAGVAAAAVTGITVVTVDDPAPAPVLQVADARTGVTAQVGLTPADEGTRLNLQLSGVRPGERCALVARARDGRTETAATWVATYTGTADVPGTTAIPADQLESLDVVTDDGRLLARLTVPPTK